MSIGQWLEMAKKCQYLPEADMKKLCEIVKELLMEESNIQPVSTPVTICGDIHGKQSLYLGIIAYGKANSMIYWNFLEWEGKFQIQSIYSW